MSRIMRVGDASKGPILTGQPIQGSAGLNHAESVRPQEAAEHEPSTELSALMTQLRALPEVRSDVVSDIERRLQNGELLTRPAAEATAQALLTSFAGLFGPPNEN